MNIDAAIEYLDKHAKSKSGDLCAAAIREALQAGGLDLAHHPRFAKDYGPTLLANGFKKYYELQQIKSQSDAGDSSSLTVNHFPGSADQKYVEKKGDIAVIQPYQGGNPAGHITMFDGVQWVSDFRQRDMWGGPGYRKYKPACVVYRP